MVATAVLFLDVLREYLRGVANARGAPAREEPAIDLPAARRHFFEAAEMWEDRKRARGADLPHERRVPVWNWLCRERNELDSFLRLVASELGSGLFAGADAETLQGHLHQAVDLLMEVPVSGLSEVRERELARVIEHALETVEGSCGMEDIARYALEVRAVRNAASGMTLSSIGRVLLGLPEMDAIRWLLTIETLQSMGPQDDWRTPREALQEIMQWPQDRSCVLHFAHDADGDEVLAGEVPWVFSIVGFARLKALGVISSERQNGWACSLTAALRPMLEEVASQHRTPLLMLAESLIAEERGTLFDHRGQTAAPTREPAAEIQARHARMVVHEIRNALVPVRMALTGIYRALDTQTPGGGWVQQQERIDRGLDRVFRFVGELQKIALLTTTLAEPFDVIAAIQDATSGLNGGLALDLQLPAAGVLPRVVGHRERFTLAVLNILRNAVQNSTGPRALVRLCAAPAPGGRVVVTLEDDGPGVPPEHRERIFEQGFTLRQGGSGQGLAMVREVVETEMKGEVRCTSGDLGGAKFVLVLPTSAKESS
jgi:signal transduction histidine kinase